MIGPEQLAAGERAEASGDYLVAAAAYRSVAQIPDERLAAEANFCLGRVSWRQSRFDKALAAFRDAQAIAERLEDRELLARVHNGVGTVHYAQGDFTAARLAYATSAQMTGDAAMRGKIALNLGVIENIEGNFEAARRRYEEAYQLFEGHGDHTSALIAVHNRGMVEADLGEWELADRSFLKVLAMATDTRNQEMVAKTLVNRSEVLIARGALDDAVSHCTRALAIYADVGDEVGRGEGLRRRGHALGRGAALAEAERDIVEALHIAVRSGVRLLEAEAARDLGVLRGQLGDAPGSGKLLRRALSLFLSLRAQREAAEVQLLLDLPPAERSLARMPD
ncbi:MAG: diguanylate cyclase [Gemmatimonadetes bacterium]|jgi:tetratricopeptide (TPR) repeat protein|nr:diguanylate cyclase [Gemmatimonadota bacterium]